MSTSKLLYTVGSSTNNPPNANREVFLAAQDIGAGQLISQEKAFLLVRSPQPSTNSGSRSQSQYKLDEALVAQICLAFGHSLNDNDKTKIRRVVRLSSTAPPLSSADAHFTSGEPVLNEQQGIWLKMDCVSHSCNPNAYRSFEGGETRLRSTRFIASGEKITVDCFPYRNRQMGYTYEELREQQQARWGCKCGCELCKQDSKTAADVHKSRHTSLRVVKSLLKSAREDEKYQSKLHGVQDIVSWKIEKLDAGYTLPATEVPRIIVAEAYYALAMHYALFSQHNDTITAALSCLRSLGFIISFPSDRPFLAITHYGLATKEALRAFILLLVSYAELRVIKETTKGASQHNNYDMMALAAAYGAKRLYAMLLGDFKDFEYDYEFMAVEAIRARVNIAKALEGLDRWAGDAMSALGELGVGAEIEEGEVRGLGISSG
ncbi:MAG: hypothetical protein Q9201_002496 [Fulgogasparrea decipioides]